MTVSEERAGLLVTRAIASFVFFGCAASACGVLPPGGESSTSDPALVVIADAGEPAIAEAALPDTPAGVCWKRTTVRGVGTIPSDCPGGERSGALCYPLCPDGYTGVGPVCWQRCPAGYTDDGALCRRDAHIMSADTSQCPWYDKCGLTLARGCSKCPDGYANDGCTCRRDVHIFAKSTQTRGAGWPMRCREGDDEDAGLCYPRCPPGARGVGPVCWVQCSGDMPIECGAGCARSAEDCAKATSDQVLKTTEAVVAIVLQKWGTAISEGIAAANSFRLPLCGGP